MGGRPSKSFLDLPDSTKATEAKGVDEIFYNLRSYGNIPGEKPIDDEDTWLPAPGDESGNATTATGSDRSASSSAAQTNIESIDSTEKLEHALKDKPKKQRDNKKNGKVLVGHGNAPQALSSLR